MYESIEDYSLIGNCISTALVSKKGSIDFFCYPFYDSPALFLKILDFKVGGSFNINIQEENYKIQQYYIRNTNVLITRYLHQHFSLDLFDYINIIDDNIGNSLIRYIRVVEGNVKLKLDLNLTPNYAQSDETIRLENPAKLKVPFEFRNGDQTGYVTSSINSKNNIINESLIDLCKGDAIYFSIGENSSNLKFEDIYQNLKDNINYWQDWTSQINYRGYWSNYLYRSALVLKLLTSSITGAPIAAPTFGLPEKLGGSKNWDYRYVWIRDAALTMNSFIRIGMIKEAESFMQWINKRLEEHINQEKPLQIMYCFRGTANIEETELKHLEGYKNSKPVRIGNAAINQFQLDIYGELIQTIYLYDKYIQKINYSLWQYIESMISNVVEKWQEEDHGIWEVRKTKRNYLFSKLMSWVALDRAIKIGENNSFPYEHRQYREIRNKIFNTINEEYFDKSKNTFVHYQNANTTDISLFFLNLTGFMTSREDKWKSTFSQIENELKKDVLLYRNTNNSITDLDEEGTFTIGACWYITCLAKDKQIEKAKYYFEKLMNYSSDNHLFAEEIDLNGSQLGNYPQGLSHIGIINTILQLSKEESTELHKTSQNDDFI